LGNKSIFEQPNIYMKKKFVKGYNHCRRKASGALVIFEKTD